MNPKRVEWRIRKQFSTGPEYASGLWVGQDEQQIDDTSDGSPPCDFGSKVRARHAAALAGNEWRVVRVSIYRVRVTRRRERVDAVTSGG